MAVLLALAALAIAASVPLAAQPGRDLLAREEPLQVHSGHAIVKGAVGEPVSTVTTVAAVASDPTGVPSAATTEYNYDDGDSASGSFLTTSAGDVHEQEFAQRFRLSQSGTVSYVTLCVGRRQSVGNSNRLGLKLTFYRDSGGRPGQSLHVYETSLTSPDAGDGKCFRLSGAVAGQQISSGDTWVGVSWLSSTGMTMMVDDSSVGNTKLSVRARVDSGSNWIAWQDHPEPSVRVFLIRLGVDHGGGTPDPVPDPPVDDEAPCVATGSGLNLTGHQLFMCIVANGEVHQLTPHKLSSKVVLFGSRSDPKAVVKMVGGCTWGAIAAVTTARKLQIRVHNTANGKEWTHNHSKGGLAPSAHSGSALCDDENGGSSSADLVVSSPSASPDSLSPGDRFTLSATVRNQGDGRSASTTLRYYRSSNSTINTSDTQVGTDAVSALSASGSSPESTSLTAPSSAGTYYYGACVDSVSGESSTSNNCSQGVRVTVSGGGTSGTRYNVGDEVTTLPTGFFSASVLSGCTFQFSGGNATIQCSRNGFFSTQSYRYTCEASTCRIESRVVTQGVWLETRR